MRHIATITLDIEVEADSEIIAEQNIRDWFTPKISKRLTFAVSIVPKPEYLPGEDGP